MAWPSGLTRTRGAWRWPAALALATAITGCREEGSGGSLPVIERDHFDAELGFAKVVKPAAWNLLRVRVRNRGADFRGRIEARTSDGLREAVYGTAVEVPGRLGAIREVSFPVFLSDTTADVDVSLTARGFGRRFTVEGHDTREYDARLLLIGGAHDLTNLTAVAAGKRLQTVRAVPEDLSPSPFAYEPFSLIVLAGTSLATAPAGVAEALGRWVERGGTLIAFPGPEWASGLPDSTRDLLGVSLGSAERSLPPELAARLGPLAAAVTYRDLEPAANAADVPGGLACIASRGAGKAFTFRVAPVGDFPGPDQAPALHDILWYAVARSIGFAGDPAPGLKYMESSAREFLQQMTGFQPPARGAVFLGLVIYLLVGFLLPYRLSARRGRREWTYAAVVVAAALATVAIYRYGILSALDAAEIEEITVLRLHRDGRAAEATSFIAAISPRFTRLDLGTGFEDPAEAAAPEPLPRALVPAGLRIARGASSVEVDRSGRLQHTPVTLYPNQAAFFRYDYQVPVSQLAAVEFVRDPDQEVEQIRFTNLARSTSAFFHQNASHEFRSARRLGPGEAFAFVPERPPLRPPLSMLLNPDWSESEGESDQLMEYRMRQTSHGEDKLAGAAREVVLANLLRQDARLAAEARPRYVAASFQQGVFPGLEGFRRKAVTVLVFEVPPAGFH